MYKNVSSGIRRSRKQRYKRLRKLRKARDIASRDALIIRRHKKEVWKLKDIVRLFERREPYLFLESLAEEIYYANGYWLRIPPKPPIKKNKHMEGFKMYTIKEYIRELEIRLQATGEELPSMREDIDLTTLKCDGLTIEAMLEQGAVFDFGLALTFLKEGLTVARKGWGSWNRRDVFIYLVNGTTIPKNNLRNEAALQVVDSPIETIKIHSHIDMRAVDGSIVVGWIASQSDVLAEDWFIVG